MLGGFLALLSAATFAFNNASLRRGVLTGSVAQAMAITVPIGVPIFLLTAAATGSLGAVTGFSPNAWLALTSAGIVHFIWGRYCNYRATRAIGANLAAPVQQTNLIIALVLAIWILGETLTPLRVLGIGLILLGPYYALREKNKKTTPASSEAAGRATIKTEPAAFQPRYAEGIVFSLLSATGYGVSPILVRIGLEGKGLGVSLAGGLIAYAAATVVMALFLLWPGQWRHAISVKPESAKWFTLSGVMVCISQMFLFMAMSIAPVTVVSPINRLSVMFRLYFSRLINPHHEVFGGKIILGTVISLLGAVALSLSTEIATSMAPAALLPILHWRWP
ncbi:MAG: EamA family transporter [Xanthobacteraceae bacterium]